MGFWSVSEWITGTPTSSIQHPDVETLARFLLFLRFLETPAMAPTSSLHAERTPPLIAERFAAAYEARAMHDDRTLEDFPRQIHGATGASSVVLAQ